MCIGPDGHYVISQHGPVECEANAFLNCVQKHNPDKHDDFVHCFDWSLIFGCPGGISMRVRAFSLHFFKHLKNGLNDASATEVLCRHVFFVLYRRRYEVRLKKYITTNTHTRKRSCQAALRHRPSSYITSSSKIAHRLLH